MARLSLKREIAAAGYEIADLLSSALLRGLGDTWDGCRDLYVWEFNALCWLARNRERIPVMNAWTAMILSDGYPTKDFTTSFGTPKPAGWYWNSGMEPRPNSLTHPEEDAAD